MFYHASFTGALFNLHPESLPKSIDSPRLGYDENSIAKAGNYGYLL